VNRARMIDAPLTPADLQAYLQQRGIAGEIYHLDVPTPTVMAAVQAVNTDPDRVVKSILFLVNGQPVLTITTGTKPVEQKAVARLFGVGRKRVKLASPEAVLDATGYLVGAVPPVGHRRPIPVVVDYNVINYDHVYAGGGAENALVRLNPQDIVRDSAARLANLQEEGPLHE
jgi:Cys-tRNA(Pro) deacylase